MSREPRYLQIAADLSRAIQEGEYGPGDRLPPKAKLIDLYDVSQQTVQNALDHLRAEGAVVTRRGAGTYVQEHRKLQRLSRNRLGRSRRASSQGPFFLDTQAAGMTASVRAAVKIEMADAETARALGIGEGDEILVRDRVLFADDDPVEIARTALPRELTRGTLIEEADSGPGGTYARLEETGHRIAYFVEAVSARRATSDESMTLRIAPGTSVLRIRRVAHADDGHPIEVTDMVIASDRYELVYEFAAE